MGKNQNTRERKWILAFLWVILAWAIITMPERQARAHQVMMEQLACEISGKPMVNASYLTDCPDSISRRD